MPNVNETITYTLRCAREIDAIGSESHIQILEAVIVALNGDGINDFGNKALTDLLTKVQARYGWVMHQEDPLW